MRLVLAFEMNKKKQQKKAQQSLFINAADARFIYGVLGNVFERFTMLECNSHNVVVITK